jgi:phenylalanyl-tRNA synthetase beta chain
LYEFGKVYAYDQRKENTGLNRYAEKQQLALFITGDKTPENWQSKPAKTDIYLLKSYTETIFGRMGIESRTLNIKTEGSAIFDDQLHYFRGDELLCSLGTLAGNVLRDFDVREQVHYACFEWETMIELTGRNEIKYYEVPKFPEVRRDLALLMDDAVTWKQIEELAYDTEKKILKKVNLFDVYTDEKMGGKKSYAVSFLIQDTEKTLTDKEIDDTMKRLITAFEKKLGAVLR